MWGSSFPSSVLHLPCATLSLSRLVFRPLPLPFTGRWNFSVRISGRSYSCHVGSGVLPRSFRFTAIFFLLLNHFSLVTGYQRSDSPRVPPSLPLPPLFFACVPLSSYSSVPPSCLPVSSLGLPVGPDSPTLLFFLLPFSIPCSSMVLSFLFPPLGQ